jgi:hypothetical protein
MSHPTGSAQVSSSRLLKVTIAVVVIACVVVQTLAEWAMLNQFGSDAQLSIWWGSFAIKTLFWLITGLGIAWLATLRRRRGMLALAFLPIWMIAILWTSFHYWQGNQALTDAANLDTSPERLIELANFQGIQAGYELDNRLAANPNTPPAVLRELHGRKDQVGTEMALAANPYTPEDILHDLSEHEDVDVRRQLANNPAISQDIVERLANDIDSQVRTRLGSNPASAGATKLR